MTMQPSHLPARTWASLAETPPGTRTHGALRSRPGESDQLRVGRAGAAGPGRARGKGGAEHLSLGCEADSSPFSPEGRSLSLP